MFTINCNFLYIGEEELKERRRLISQNAFDEAIWKDSHSFQKTESISIDLNEGAIDRFLNSHIFTVINRTYGFVTDKDLTPYSVTFVSDEIYPDNAQIVWDMIVEEFTSLRFM